MPVNEMAETLAEQNVNPPFAKDQDGRLRSKVEAGEAKNVEELAQKHPDLARQARVATAAHARLKKLGFGVGQLVGAKSWHPDTNSTNKTDAERHEGHLCRTLRVLLKIRRAAARRLSGPDGRSDAAAPPRPVRRRAGSDEGEEGAVAVRLSEAFGVVVLRAAWEIEDGMRGRRLQLPENPKRALYALLARRVLASLTPRAVFAAVSTHLADAWAARRGPLLETAAANPAATFAGAGVAAAGLAGLGTVVVWRWAAR